MWSYMRFSSRSRAKRRAVERPSQFNARRSWKILRSPFEAWRNFSGEAPEARWKVHEVGEVAKADVIGDVGDRTVVIGEAPGRMAQPRAHQILVRRHAEHVGK